MPSLWWWFLHITGSDNTSGLWYGFWSGFGSDLGEVVLIGGLVSVYRRHVCIAKGCWRIGRQTTAAGHMVCHRHHPEGQPTAEDIHRLHHEAKRKTRARA